MLDKILDDARSPFGDLPAIARIPDANRAYFIDEIAGQFSKWTTFEWEVESGQAQKDFTLYEGIENAARFLSEQLVDAKPFFELGFAPPMTPAALQIFGKQLAETATWAHECKLDIAAFPGTVIRRGPKGSRNFPRIGDLVKCFEIVARLAGGRFTLDKKAHKGSLLTALDNLRARLLAKPQFERMARYLPAPDQHPVATYERALIEARGWPCRALPQINS